MNTMRPSERASEAQINRDREFNESVKGGLKKAAGVGLSAAGAGIGSRVLPFLSEHIPFDLALKGISKVSPKLGDFLRRGLENGLDAKEGLGFVKDQIQKSEQKPAKEERNIIQQYDPELHEYITQGIAKGKSPVEIGQKAMDHERFNKTIKQIEKDHKIKISQLLQSIYGTGENAMPQNNPMQPQQQPQQQPSQNKNDLLKAMQDMRQIMQNMKK